MLDQAPKAGDTVARGTAVTLVVSTGPPGVALPELVGLRRPTRRRRSARASSSRAAAGAGAGYSRHRVRAEAEGRREAEARHERRAADREGEGQSVPNVTGQAQQQAVSTLRQAGLEVTTAQVPSSQPKGSVVAQHPAAGQKLARGSAVLLNISAGSPTATTRSATTTAAVTPTPRRRATTTRACRLRRRSRSSRRGGSRRSSCTSRRAVPQVSSSRARGAARASGSTSPRPSPGTPARVPDVTGEDAATAQQELEDAGFTVVQVAGP